MCEKIDSKTFQSGLVIDFYLDNDEIIAKDRSTGNKIGYVIIELEENDESLDCNYAGQILVEKPYRRKGIATKLHQLAEQQFGKFKLPNFKNTFDSGDGMTEDGQNFYNGLLKKNLLSDEHAEQMKNFGNENDEFNDF